MPSSKAAQPAKKLPRSFKYGMPLYSVVWPEGSIFYVCGGGGSTSTGIKNRVVFAECISGHLTDQLGDFNFGPDCPMRMAITPNMKSMVVAMGLGGIRRLELDTRGKIPKLSEVSGDLAARLKVEVAGEVKSLAFNRSGEQLLLGWADGGLAVLDWPSLQPRLDLRSPSTRLADGVRDLDSSPTPRNHVVTCVLDNGTLEQWDWESGRLVLRAGLARGEFRSNAVMTLVGPEHSSVQPLPRGLHGATFARAKYGPVPTKPGSSSSSSSGAGGRAGAGSSTPSPSASPLLYALMNNREGCWATQWAQPGGPASLSLVKWRKVSGGPGSGLDVSRDGAKLAVSTSDGSTMVLSASDLSTLNLLPKAHMVFSTGVVLAPDGSQALSISADASATAVPASKQPRLRVKTSAVGRVLLLTVIFIALMLACALQVIRVLKWQGRMDLVWKLRSLMGWKGVPDGATLMPAGSQCPAGSVGQCQAGP
ncbi:regulator of COP-II vesicle coat [Haematococcus lacustris]